MRHPKTILPFLAAAVLFGLGLLSIVNVGCSRRDDADGLAKIKKHGKVIVGVFGDKPPFGYIDRQGRNTGYDVALARRIAGDLLGDENKIEFVALEAANRVAFLQCNKVDIILANFTRTPERAEKVDFAKPYMKVALGIVNTLLFAWAHENKGFKVIESNLGNADVIAPAVKKGTPSSAPGSMPKSRNSPPNISSCMPSTPNSVPFSGIRSGAPTMSSLRGGDGRGRNVPAAHTINIKSIPYPFIEYLIRNP
jgi:hypothetical protein